MLVDLVRLTTRDGCQLDGCLRRPVGGRHPDIDAVCLVHGTGGNFYSSSLFDFLTEPLVQLGIAVLRVNTRGHDGISTAVTARGGLRLGAAYEIVDDCRHDLVGWVDWLRANVGPRVGMLGHSMGAVKCLYSAAREPSLAPRFVIALSPPRLSYAWFCAGPRRPEFLEQFERAEALCLEGQPNQLLEVTLPLPMVIAAGGYLDKYGPQERYNFVPLLPGVTCRTLLVFGGQEVAKNVAFQELPDTLRTIAAKRPNFQVEVVPDGDHFYSQVRPQAWEIVRTWLS